MSEIIDYSSIAIMIATIILVCITAYYAIINKKLLNEMKKERQIKWLEKRLEKLYLPLSIKLTAFGDIESNALTDETKKEAVSFILNLSPYIYLADASVRDEIWGLIYVAECEGSLDDILDQIENWNQFLNNLDESIKETSKRLNDLAK